MTFLGRDALRNPNRRNCVPLISSITQVLLRQEPVCDFNILEWSMSDAGCPQGLQYLLHVISGYQFLFFIYFILFLNKRWTSHQTSGYQYSGK